MMIEDFEEPKNSINGEEINWFKSFNIYNTNTWIIPSIGQSISFSAHPSFFAFHYFINLTDFIRSLKTEPKEKEQQG